jgi:nucleoside-diphosphate-sugar epimerase
VIPTILSQALAGAMEIQLGSLEPQRDLTFVEDTAQAFVLAGHASGIEGETIHFGQGKAIAIGELAARCLEVTGSKARIVTMPERQRPEKSEVELLLCDPTKAHRLLGWTPQVSLDEGLRRTAEYVRSHLTAYPSSGYTI